MLIQSSRITRDVQSQRIIVLRTRIPPQRNMINTTLRRIGLFCPSAVSSMDPLSFFLRIHYTYREMDAWMGGFLHGWMDDNA